MHAQVDAGLDKKLVLGDPKAPRFVFWNKKLRPTPSGPDVLTFDLLSIWGSYGRALALWASSKSLQVGLCTAFSVEQGQAWTEQTFQP